MANCLTCRFSELCKVPDEKRDKCKANDTPDTRPKDLIFGKTWQEIQAMQQKKG